jgi:thiamine kinase-like enzyme
MAVKTKNHTPEELHRLLGYFSINISEVKFEPLTSGLINDTYLVYSKQSPTHILQRINDSVFKDVAGLMNNCATALEQLNAQGYTKVELIKTKKEEYFYQGPEGFWRLVNYIAHTVTYDTTNSLQIAFEAGRIIGRFQTLLQHEDPSNYKDTIPDFHNLELRMNQFEEAFSNTSEDNMEECKSVIKFVKSTSVVLQKNISTTLQVRICHNDTKLNNILFSKDTDKALCLIDLDTIMKGHFLFDFGDAVRTVVNPAREDEQDNSLIQFRTDYFEALVRGIASNEHIWTGQELQSLPYGAVLMPFLHGLRALTDYLNGNKYYKVSYEKQNYDRAKSLFQFTKKTLEQLPFMKQTIDEHFPIQLT